MFKYIEECSRRQRRTKRKRKRSEKSGGTKTTGGNYGKKRNGSIRKVKNKEWIKKKG
jgi:hypothetical protein